MDRIGIVLLGLFAAVGLASLLQALWRALVVGREEGIREMELRLTLSGQSPTLPFCIRDLSEALCRKGDCVRITVIDAGLAPELADDLLLDFPTIRLEKKYERGTNDR